MKGWHLHRRHRRKQDIVPMVRDAVVESLTDGVIVLDRQNRVMGLNQAVKDIIGPRAADAIGQSIARVLADHPKLVACYYDETLPPSVITAGEGEPQRHHKVLFSPINDQYGQPAGRMIVLRDVTQQVRAEEALRRAEAETRKNLTEQTLLREAAVLVSYTSDLPTVLHQIAKKMGEATDATSAYICSLDKQELTSTVLAEFFSPQAGPQERISDLGETHNRDIAFLEKLQTSQFVVEHIDDPDLAEDLRAHMQERGAQTVLCIPLRIGDEVVGFIELWESGQRRDFTLKEIDLCQAIAQNAAVAIENARLNERMQQELAERIRAEEALRTAETETRKQLSQQLLLRKAGAVIGSSLNLTDVLSHLAEQMGQVVDATSAYVLIWKPETRIGTVLADYVSPHACAEEQQPDLGASYAVEDQRFLGALAAGQPWVHYADDPDLPESERDHLLQYSAQTVLSIPLQIRDRTIGFAELWESRQRRNYTPKEIALCQAIAQNAAIAIENARLYEQAQQELAERVRAEEALRQLNQQLESRIKERTAELTSVNTELTREIDERAKAETELLQRNRELLSLQSAMAATASSLDLPFLLETVTWEMVNLFGVEGCTISEWDSKANTLTLIAEYGVTSWWVEASSPQTYHLVSHSLKTRVLKERCAQQVVVSQPNMDTGELADMRAENVKALLILPMMFQAHVVGLVELKDSHEERVFTDHEISLAQLLANQAASAIENARLYAETQRRLREQMALREASAAILSALDHKTVLTRIAEQMGHAIDATSAYICGLDSESMPATVLAEYIGPAACPQEQSSDLGTTHLDDDVEFLRTMQAGQHDTAHVDGPNLSESDRARVQHYGAKSILYIPLLIRGQLIGFVELWESRHQREFTPEEISLCHSIAQQAAVALENARLYERAQQEIAERKRAEEQIRASLNEKEVLLQEIHHRVKNNLQVVSSLLNLQSNYVQDQAALEMFRESQNRILSMALIHERLYRSQDLARINLGEYIQTLASELVRSYGDRVGPVNIRVNAAGVILSVDQAVPCGLIVNELVSNALKHAFRAPADAGGHRRNGRENEIRIDLLSDAERQVTMIVADNGVGFPKDIDIESLDSLGLRLINTLIGQLEGTLELTDSDGSEFKLTFPAS